MRRLPRSLAQALLVVCLLLVGGQALWAQSAAAGLYNQGNALYREGDFAGALQAYRRAAVGVEDPRLFYNLGNAAYKTGALGEAILWYERALRLDPRDADISANLDFARQARLDRETAEAGGLGDYLYAAYSWPTLNELSVVFCLGFLAAFGLGVWRLLRTGGLLWMGALVAAVCLVVCAGGWLGLRVSDEGRQEAVVLVGATTARSGPDAARTALFELHEGTKVRVERSEGDWLLGRLPNGLGGWLLATDLGVI